MGIEDDAISDDVLGNDNPSEGVTYSPKNFTDLKNCIETAEEGATIELNGTYVFDSTVTVNRAVNIVGVGDGANIKHDSFNTNDFRFFTIESSASDVVLSNLKFDTGTSNYGSAVCWNGENGIITNCEFINNLAKSSSLGGGALAVFGNNCSIIDCYFKNNYAREGNGGALLLKANDCRVENCNFTINHCSNSGGAIAVYNESNKIVKCLFENNYVDNNSTDKMGGGAIFSGCEDLLIDGCTFSSNKALQFSGGAIVLAKSNVVQNSFFNGNLALLGNDIYSSSFSVVKSCYFILDYNETEQQAIYETGLLTQVDNTFNITKIDSHIDFISTGMVFEYGASGSITVKVDGGVVELKNIKVLNHPEARIAFSNNVLTISGLDVGSYTLRVTTTPDENHYSVDADLGITVKKATAVIKASAVTVALKKGTLWTIKLVDSRNNAPIANMVVTLKVYTGSKASTVNLITHTNGIASYQTKDLAKGTHKVVVSAIHNGYDFSPVTSSIKVIKPKALTFKIQKRSDDKKGSLVSFIVKDKKTGKGVNGVKVKLLIYTGKNYVTINLKTKKVGKYKGAVGYSTNKLSVGKHKVIIMPSTIKYSGSKSTFMKIKKSAKKYPAWETKVSG